MFKKKKYTIIRQAISRDLAAFVANYFSMQKQVYDTCRHSRYFSPFETIIGYYEGEDEQIKCIKNRIVLFNSSVEHYGVTCTNEPTKLAINFNYV